MELQGLPLIAGKDARVLILEPFPSEASLRVAILRVSAQSVLRRCRELVARRVAALPTTNR